MPLLAFLFLVALGVDYTIFLVHRARMEARAVGTREGMVTALATTGGVITSAGVVLAGVFAALGLLPLVTLGQIGLIVGIGVLMDTLVVRTLIVPALFAVVGDGMWWPSRTITDADAADARWYDRVLAWLLRRPWVLFIALFVVIAALFAALLVIGPPVPKS